jgi:hypothetical protein
LVFTPKDVNDSGYSTTLARITLVITDDVETPAQAQIDTPTTIIFPNARVGATETQNVSVTNTATAPAADLDVTPTAINSATASGSISLLAPGGTDYTDMAVGLVARFSQIEGYRCLSLMRAFGVVKCQLALA